MAGSGWVPEFKCYKFNWNATDNGTVAAHALGNLPTGFVITSMTVDVVTALTGGGTIVCGLDGGGDADGFYTDMDALTAGAYDGIGALVYEPTDKHAIPYKIASATDGVLVTVGTTAYTVGEINFYFCGFQA